MGGVSLARPPTVWKDPTDDAGVEKRIRQIALPAALLLAWLVTNGGPRFISRIFLSMWVHGIGHAVTAWLCGFGAFPGPWVTPVSDERMLVVTVLLLLVLGYAIFRAWTAGAHALSAGLALLVLVTLSCTFGLRPYRARALFVFGGDAGCLVLGTLLMATIIPRPAARSTEAGCAGASW